MNKYFFAVCSLIIFFSCTTSESTNQKETEAVWAQEFNEAIDTTIWSYELGDKGWGNKEWQNYTNSLENAFIEDGKLVLKAIKTGDSLAHGNFTSARLVTRNKYNLKYGKIEARMKLPKGQGIWPAFWMLGSDHPNTSWPQCGEIDLMEYLGHETNKVYGTIHGPGHAGMNGISGNRVLGNTDLSADFHVYTTNWQEDKIEWFIDGEKYFEVSPESLPDGQEWVFNDEFFFLLNLAVGGNWPGYPDETTVFPQQFEVDYIRVYEK